MDIYSTPEVVQRNLAFLWPKKQIQNNCLSLIFAYLGLSGLQLSYLFFSLSKTKNHTNLQEGWKINWLILMLVLRTTKGPMRNFK